MATVQCLSPCGIVPTSCRYRITCLKIHVPQRRQSASYAYYSNNFKVSKVKGVTYNMVFQLPMLAVFQHSVGLLQVIVAYAPTEDASDVDKNSFYHDLDSVYCSATHSDPG